MHCACMYLACIIYVHVYFIIIGYQDFAIVLSIFNLHMVKVAILDS